MNPLLHPHLDVQYQQAGVGNVLKLFGERHERLDRVVGELRQAADGVHVRVVEPLGQPRHADREPLEALLQLSQRLELPHVVEDLVVRDLGVAQVVLEDPGLPHVPLLHGLRALHLGLVRPGRRPQTDPVGEGAQEAVDVVVLGPLRRDDALVLALRLHEASVGGEADLLVLHHLRTRWAVVIYILRSINAIHTVVHIMVRKCSQ